MSSEALVLGVVIGVMCSVLAESLAGRARRRREDFAREAALELLRAAGNEPARYLPSVGLGQDSPVREALDEVVGSGTIVLDRRGAVVGRVATRSAVRPHLRLVVDNSWTENELQ